MSDAGRLCGCGAAIAAASRTGRCRRCAQRAIGPEARAVRAANARRQSSDPATRAARVEKIRAAWADPALRARKSAQSAEQMARRLADPAARAALVASGRRLGTDHGVRLDAEARRRGAIVQQARALDWCPRDLWPLNAELKRKRFDLAERKRLIAEEIDRRDPRHQARRAIAAFDREQRERDARDRAARY